MNYILRGLLLEELDETFLGSLTVIVNGVLLVVGGPELKSGESMDCNTLNFVGGGINLSDDQVLVVSELSGEGLIDGGQLIFKENIITKVTVEITHRFAVSAPGSVELNEDILSGVEDNLGEGLSNNSLLKQCLKESTLK
jgi:hypothetical protein